MKLLFDHGTLVLTEAPDLSRRAIPGLLWDPRVELYRAPAYRYAEVVEALRMLRVPLTDEVERSGAPADAKIIRYRRRIDVRAVLAVL